MKFYSKHVVDEFYINITLVAAWLTLDLNMAINYESTQTTKIE